MEVKVYREQKVPVMIDIQFPVYSKSIEDFTDITNYTFKKMLENFDTIYVSYSADNLDVEYSIWKNREVSLTEDNVDYVLGRGKYTCTEEEFNAAVQHVVDIIQGGT